ncbi:YppF family protein [Peribacillus sp. B-H-3]|uniref:YppF family protein n=1 Tax=Peribacillus sp. B-H-3 TaxID=3400420 RepID=UPI003B023683
MVLEILIQHFICYKNRKPQHANELLDYIQEKYLKGELSFSNYKNLFGELEKRGAKKPFLAAENSLRCADSPSI